MRKSRKILVAVSKSESGLRSQGLAKWHRPWSSLESYPKKRREIKSSEARRTCFTRHPRNLGPEINSFDRILVGQARAVLGGASSTADFRRMHARKAGKTHKRA